MNTQINVSLKRSNTKEEIIRKVSRTMRKGNCGELVAEFEKEARNKNEHPFIVAIKTVRVIYDGEVMTL